MKINAMKAMLISSILIIVLYCLGLFLPIILNTKKETKIFNYHQNKIVFFVKEKTTFL